MTAGTLEGVRDDAQTSLWALPVALTVLGTGLAWDPHTTTYGALKALLLAGGALLTTLVAAWRVQRARGSWALDRTTAAAGLLLGWATLSLLWAPSPSAGLSDLTLAGAAAVWWTAARGLVRGARASRLALGALAVAGSGTALVALWERRQGAAALSGTIGNPNHLAVYLAATVPAVPYLVWGDGTTGELGSVGRWLRRGIAGALVLPIAAALWLSGSRGGVVALAAAAALALALRQRARSRRLWGLAIGALVGVLLLGLATAVPWGGRQSLRGRLYLARISSSMWLERPVAGHGVGGFATRFPEAQANHLAHHPAQRGRWTNARTAHCEPLQGFVELGLVGGGLGLGLGLVLLLGMVGGRDPPAPRVLAGAGVLAAVTVGCLVEGGLHTVGLLALAALGATLVAGQGAPRTAPSVARSAWVAAALVFTSTAIVVHTARQYTAERLLGRAYLEPRPAQRAALLERAVALAPNGGKARFYLGLARAAQGRNDQALKALRRSDADFRNLGTQLAIGNVLMGQHRWSAAAAASRRAVWLNPRYAAAHHNLGLALRRLHRRGASRESLSRARRLWPGRWLEPWRIRAIRRLIRAADDPL